MSEQAATQPAASYPPARAGWFLVAMLTIAYIFSFIDRYILGLLIEPIKAELSLTDTQIGLVLGPAFAVFYATMGLPLGWLVDRKRRVWIVAAGVFVWSFATAVSGLAKNFTQLFIARMSVGVGEATLSPAAMSLISDSFPPERRGKPIAVYTAALSVGAAIASLIGGAVLLWAKTNESLEVPLFGPMAPWQLTFFAVGAPGLILAGVFFFLREPPRGTVAVMEGEQIGNGVKDALRYVGRNFGVYAGFVSLVCIMTITAYSQGFLPAVFDRTWGWPAEKYAFVNAVVLLAVGPASVFLSGALSDRWAQQGRKDASIKLLVFGFLLMVPTAILPMFMPSAEAAFAVLFVNTAGIAIVSAMGVVALLAITPAQIRGQITALYYMAISLSGLVFGPTTVGWLSTNVFGEEELRLAYAATIAIYALVPLLCVPLTLRAYKRQLAKIMAAEQGAN